MRAAFSFLAFWIAMATPVFGTDGLTSWLSPKLIEVERRQKEAKQSFDALGEPMVSQTVPQFGFMVAPQFGKEYPTEKQERWVELDLGKGYDIDQIALIPVRMDWHLLEHPSYSFPKRFKVEVSDDPRYEWKQVVGDFMKEDFPYPGVSPVIMPVKGFKVRFVRLIVTAPRIFALSEIMVMKGNRNIAIGCRVNASDSAQNPPRWAVDNLVDGRMPIGAPILYEELPYDGLYAGEPEKEMPVWMQLDLGSVMSVEEVRLHPIHGRLGTDSPGYRFPSQFRIELSNTEDFTKPTILFETKEPFSNPGNNAVTIPAFGTEGRFLRIVLIPGDLPVGGWRFGLSEVEVYSGGQNVARNAKVEATHDPYPVRKDWPKTLLVDGCTSYGRIIELPEWLNNWTRRKELKAEIEALNQQQVELLAEGARRLWLLLGGLGTISAAGLIAIVINARRVRQRELNAFRRQIANDLHDEIGSSLAAIAVISENAAEYPGEQSPEDFQKINRIARETTDAMRETLWIAGSRAELAIDLMKHLQLAATRMLPRRDVKWLSTVEAFPTDWPVEPRRQVFLFFKETLANIVRHSRADKIELSAKIVENQFELEIRDNGRGFQPNLANAGIGLQSLRQRAGALKGTMHIETRPGAGTHVVLKVPVPPLRSSLAESE